MIDYAEQCERSRKRNGYRQHSDYKPCRKCVYSMPYKCVYRCNGMGIQGIDVDMNGTCNNYTER